MDDKLDEVAGQYELHLLGKKRIRGGLLLETKEGNFTLTGYRESAARIGFDEMVKKILVENGYPYVDQGMRNKKGEWLTKDRMGNRWHMKKWYAGKECNLKDEGEVCLASEHLAKLHKLLVLSEKNASETSELIAASMEVEQKEMQPFCITMEKDYEKILERRTREMRRVYNYIRHKKKRNEMEICILNMFPAFYEQAGMASETLAKAGEKELLKSQIEEGRVFHGSYNYHNILFGEEEQIITTNFEKSAYGIQVMDLYDFVRKFMEKNNWNISQGIHVLRTYQKNRILKKEEGILLYVSFLFPEKFWKQMNFYYNGKKSWMSVKNLDKIKKIEQQEKERRKFLEEAKRVLF